VPHEIASNTAITSSPAESDVKKAVINENAESPTTSESTTVEAVAPARKRRAVRAKETVAKETRVDASSTEESPTTSESTTVEAVAPARKRRAVRAKKTDSKTSGESKKDIDE